MLPGSAASYHGIGRVLGRKGDLNGAIKNYKIAIKNYMKWPKVDPQPPKLREARAACDEALQLMNRFHVPQNEVDQLRAEMETHLNTKYDVPKHLRSYFTFDGTWMLVFIR